MTEHEPSPPLLQLPLQLEITKQHDQTRARIFRHDGQPEIILSTQELLLISKAVRGGVIIILQYHLVVEHHREAHSLTIISGGAATSLRIGIPAKGLVDQKLHFSSEGIFFDRGKDAASGAALITLYPLPDQSGCFPRET